MPANTPQIEESSGNGRRYAVSLYFFILQRWIWTWQNDLTKRNIDKDMGGKMMWTKWGTNKNKTLHKPGSSTVASMALEREHTKKEKRKKQIEAIFQHGYLNWVTHPNRNAAEQGLIFFSGRNAVLSLWYSDSMLKVVILFLRSFKG